MNPFFSQDVIVKDLLDRYPQLLQTFMDLGLLCVGCPAEAFHTLADVAREYQLDLGQLRRSMDKVIGDNGAAKAYDHSDPDGQGAVRT